MLVGLIENCPGTKPVFSSAALRTESPYGLERRWGRHWRNDHREYSHAGAGSLAHYLIHRLRTILPGRFSHTIRTFRKRFYQFGFSVLSISFNERRNPLKANMRWWCSPISQPDNQVIIVCALYLSGRTSCVSSISGGVVCGSFK
jgi:hypothetical protein